MWTAKFTQYDQVAVIFHHPHPSTSPSEQNPDIPTPPERSWWPHPWMSPIPKIEKPHVTHKIEETFLTKDKKN